MNIQFLYFDSCPNADAAYARLEDVVQALVPGTPIEKVKISSNRKAEDYSFSGSPTIHIDGNPAGTVRIHEGDGVLPRWLIEAGVLRALKPKGLLFLCVANSARSQIGEGIARKLAPVDVRVQSAGSNPTSVRPEAATVLAELDIDTSTHRSKNVSHIDPATVDTVITLCREEECPVFLGQAHRVHWGLPDPAAVTGDEEARIKAFRQVRDELKRRIALLF
ncbi:MAG: arsenate reductase ArsC [Myxococcota bacterium]|nr:arsenate reductase ArsC [Myxococcota bacterium]